ncbi:MAG: RAMP superfamily CRISPR-associated protein [Syntrophobacteraceae bacterium]|jgi:CRISPR-associated protein Csx10
MKYYRLTAQLLSPLMIQQDRQSNAPTALDYLPGSTLRGSVAATYLRMGASPEDPDFRHLFLDQPVHFPNLFPSDSSETIPKVLPLTAASCKRHPGFLGQGGHGVADNLAAAVYSHLSGKAAGTDFGRCPECNHDMKPFGGFWSGDVIYSRKSDSTLLYQRHTGIDRATGTVAPSIFFALQMIADFHKRSPTSHEPDGEEFHRQSLCGGVFLDDEHLRILKALVEYSSVFAGGDRTRGFGEMKLSIEEASPPTFDLKGWNLALRGKLGRLFQIELPAGIYFSLKLESPAILVDAFLRASPQITLPFPGVEPVLRVAKARIVRGWQSAWGLPKPDDTGLAMGSVCLFRHPGLEADNLNGLENFLAGLLTGGIGLRREEGFGKVSICDCLHEIEEVI